jgi:hypothetical protein
MIDLVGKIINKFTIDATNRPEIKSIILETTESEKYEITSTNDNISLIFYDYWN